MLKITGTQSKYIDIPRLYHISFRADKSGMWEPNTPDGMGQGDVEHTPFPYPEPTVPRISLSSSLEGCFLGVYPNVYRYFEKDNYPYMLFNVYTPVYTGNESMVSTDDIVKKEYVWDAHLTGEWWILSKVQMKYVGQIKVINPRKTITRYTHPFGSTKWAKIDYRVPSRITIEKMDGFSET